jgi:hypothetical protein
LESPGVVGVGVGVAAKMKMNPANKFLNIEWHSHVSGCAFPPVCTLE